MQTGIAEILHPIILTCLEDTVKFFNISQLTGKICLLSLMQLIGASIAWSGILAPIHGHNSQNDQYNDRYRHDEEREWQESRRHDWNQEHWQDPRHDEWGGNHRPPRRYQPCVEQWVQQPIAQLRVRGNVAELTRYGRNIEDRIARWYTESDINPFAGRKDVWVEAYNVQIVSSYSAWRSEQFIASIRVLSYQRVCR